MNRAILVNYNAYICTATSKLLSRFGMLAYDLGRLNSHGTFGNY
jgi:hypothetical protein